VEGISEAQSRVIPQDLIRAVRDAKQYLSDLDGAIGDGDHGVNLNRGFGLWAEELARNPADLPHSLSGLSKILLSSIGGAMGPLYGMIFRGLAQGCEQAAFIDASVFERMLAGAVQAVRSISQAKVGDKTLMDVLLPAEEAYRNALREGMGFAEALDALSRAAEQGRESTRQLVARVGRASRLGERSRGALDAGAASCALILTTMAGSIRGLLAKSA
jgi:dihydroxyacetone kinase-like protein